MNLYPELRGGRFALIADFEDPAQMEIIQAIRVSDGAMCVLSPRGGRAATGAGCLSFTAGSPDDTVVIANQRGQNWYLKRDWRAFDLLMMSVYAPGDMLSLNVSIGGGSAERRATVFTKVALDRGWNVLRLDLGEVGEGVPLDDVREVRLNVDGLSGLPTVLIDDIVLTGYRVALFGDPENTEGELYVERVGRRLRLGAGGRFELTASNGQIRGWHNLAEDPHRLRNLLYESVLGPNPVVVGTEPGGAGGFAGWGKTVAASQRLIEANAVRVILECEWHFVDEPSRARGGLDGTPFHRWRYTIYPTGQIYVLLEATSGTDDGWSPPLGLEVTLASPVPDGVRTFVPRMDAEGGDGPMFAVLSSPTSGAELFFVPDTMGETTRFLEEVSEDRRAVSIVAVDARNDAPVKRWVSHLYLSTRGTATVLAKRRAVDAVGIETPVRIEQGLPDGSSEGAVRADGFNRVEGCYGLRPDAGRVRVVMDGSKRAVFSPAFCIGGASSRQFWVYVDHLAHKVVRTNDAGRVLFQLPDVVDRRREVEVLFRRAGR